MAPGLGWLSKPQGFLKVIALIFDGLALGFLTHGIGFLKFAEYRMFFIVAGGYVIILTFQLIGFVFGSFETSPAQDAMADIAGAIILVILATMMLSRIDDLGVLMQGDRNLIIYSSALSLLTGLLLGIDAIFVLKGHDRGQTTDEEDDDESSPAAGSKKGKRDKKKKTGDTREGAPESEAAPGKPMGSKRGRNSESSTVQEAEPAAKKSSDKKEQKDSIPSHKSPKSSAEGTDQKSRKNAEKSKSLAEKSPSRSSNDPIKGKKNKTTEEVRKPKVARSTSKPGMYPAAPGTPDSDESD